VGSTTKTPSHQGPFPPVGEDIDAVAREIVDSAFKVHSALGPGLLESVYATCIRHELEKRRLGVRVQHPVPIVYDGIRLDGGLRLDLLVNDCVIVELKAVERLLSVHEAQVLSYLRLARKRLGFLINFNVPRIRDGIRRFALDLGALVPWW
jgi:GxxExxY protein